MTAQASISISAKLVDHSLNGARAAGMDIQRLLRKCGIDAQDFQRPKARIAVEKVVMLARYCNGAMEDELNGLLEYPVRLGNFRMMALTVVHADCLGAALERLVQYHNLFHNSFLYQLETDHERVSLRLERIPGHRVQDPFAVDWLLSISLRFLGWLVNRRLPLDAVSLDFSAPEYADEYRYIFHGAPVQFDSDRLQVEFSRNCLEFPVAQTEASVESYCRRAPMDIYLPLDVGGRSTVETEILLKEALFKRLIVLNLDNVADALNMKPQTLRRKLQEEGSHFNTLKAQVRRDFALHLLDDAEHSVETIANKCGYAEPSTFIRAFKAWTGFTPLQFRKEMHGAA